MYCYLCAKLLENVDTIVCYSCNKQLQSKFRLLPNLPNIEIGGYFFKYDNEIKAMIRNIKFQGNVMLAQRFARYINQATVPSIFFESDVIVPISSHWFRQLWRGKPHIPLIFSQLFLHCNHVKLGLLKRSRYSSSSFKLSKFDRLNVSPRFKWLGSESIRSVTLLDDICTTGSTITEISRMLKNHGVQSIRVLVGAYVDLNK